MQSIGAATTLLSPSCPVPVWSQSLVDLEDTYGVPLLDPDPWARVERSAVATATGGGGGESSLRGVYRQICGSDALLRVRDEDLVEKNEADVEASDVLKSAITS